MKKKKILLGLSIVAAAFVVSACGKKAESNNNNNNQNDSQKDPDDKPTDTESQVYTVTWKNGDSNHKIDELNEGSQITAPTQTPTKDSTAQYDYTFDGWYTEATGGTKVTDFGTATADVTYYARFTETVKQYTYTFFDEDGVTELKKETVNYGTQITAPTVMTKPETESNFYVFDGWYTEKTGGTKVTDFSTVTGAVSYYARYTEKGKYNYSFVVDGGAIKTDTIKEGETIVPPAQNPTKEATAQYTYTFEGWFTAAEGGQKVENFGAIEGNTTYYAHFKETVNKYTYKFIVNGNEVVSENVNYGTQIDAPENPTKTATAQYTYTFDGWYTQAEGGQKVESFGAIEGNVTYYAHFTETTNKYTYTFVVEGTEITSDPVNYGTQIEAPEDPTKSSTPEFSYEFDGWYTEATGGTKVTDFGTISGNVTYYAHFKETKNSYTYKFIFDSEENPYFQATIKYGEAIVPPSVNPSMDPTPEFSYEFAGWYTEAMGGEKVTDFGTITGNVTYYARFTGTMNQYTYTFYDENGTEITSNTVDYGTVVEAPSTPSKDNTAEYTYTFDGWYTSKTGGEKVTSFVIQGAASYYARFTETKNQYTYTFYNYDGTVYSTATIDYGAQVVVPATNPTKDLDDGNTYVFNGWYTAAEGGEKVTEYGILVDNVSYYAQFIIETEQVTRYTYTFYDADGSVLKTDYIAEGEAIIAPKALPEKEGNQEFSYTFDGWYTQAEGGEKVTDFGNISSDISFYARFIEAKNQYTYTFYDENGSVISTNTVDYGTAIQVPADQTKDKTAEYTYTFDGWYTEATGGEKVTTFGNVEANVSYYARFTETVNKYTYTFYDENGDVITTATVNYGTAIQVPVDQTKENTAEYTYTFDGWYTQVEGGEKVTTFGNVEANVSYYARFTETKNQYTYAFYGADGEVLCRLTKDYGVTLIIPTDPEKAATAQYTYTFDGWYTEAEGGTKVETFGVLVADVSYYAHFTATVNKYTYTFYDENGEVITTKTVNYGTTFAAPEDPVKASTDTKSYTFDGWYTQATGGEKVTTFGAIEANVSYYARFIENNLYTVTFVVDGVTYDTIKVEENNKVTRPTDPTKDGYYLSAWTLDGEEFDFNTQISSNITLVAVFEEALEEENVGFGGTYTAWADLFASTGSTRTDDKGRTKLGATSDTDSVSMNGFTFEGKAVLESGILNTQGTSITIQILNNNASINMSATWASGDVGVIKVYKDGSLYHTSSSTYSSKTALTLDLTGLSAGTYTIKAEKTGSATGLASLQVSTIYYTRVVQYVTVSYVTNSDQVIEATRVKKGDSLGELPTVNNRSGYRGEGWYTTEDFVVGTEASASASITANTTLYYKWIELTEDDLATITFNVNVDGKTIDSLQIEKGTKLAALPELNIEGYRLDGWYTDSNFHTAFNINTYTFTTDTTLYAQYIRVYNVTFLDKDGKEIKTVTVDANTKVTDSIAKPYIEGYKFDHWVIDGTNTEFDLATEYIGADYTLKAVYVVDSNPVAKVNITSAQGYQEAATIKFDKYKNSSNVYTTEYNVYLSGESFNGTRLTDKNLYITINGNTVTAELFGLKAGSYNVTVVPVFDDVELEAAQMNATFAVTAYDRSGYAHFNNTEGVGAYNDDGTLKDNAIVLYVTDENKNTISLSYGGVTVTGIGNILNSVGADNGSGTASNGGAANTNQGILKKLGEAGIPLVVRFVGCVSDSGLYAKGSFTAANTSLINGLTKFNSADYGGTEGDNGHMARMKSAKDVTLEGVGNDATIDGWGFHFMCESSAPDLGKNFEVRNLKFINTPEDAIGMEGVQASKNASSDLSASVERCWIHNNEFYGPTIVGPAESDKKEGDGSCDFKRGQFLTVSYNYFEGCHKTNLVGSADYSLQFNLTYHHNFWYMCKARGPLTRRANVHMYNNIFYGQTDYAVNTRADAYIFTEYNQFYLCKSPFAVEGGAIKSYNDNISSVIWNKGSEPTYVTDKSQTVSNNCQFSARGVNYSQFDTDSSLSYIPTNDYDLQEDIVEARKVIYARCGVAKSELIDPSTVTMDDISLLNKMISNPTINNLSVGQTVTPGKLSKAIYAFKITSYATATISYASDADASTGVLCNQAGVSLLKGSGTVVLAPGIYWVQANQFQPGDSATLAQGSFKEFTINSLTLSEYDSSALNAELIANYNNAVANIPSTITYTDSCYSAINAAKNAYIDLGASLQSEVDYSPVTTALNAYKIAGEAYVEGLINQIELPVTASNSSLVISAKSAYTTLISKVSDASVSNYATLVEAESQMNSLAVDIFLNQANQIPTEITYTSACNELISNAEAAYESLDSEQRNQSAVKTAYAMVTAARETYDSLAVIANVESAMSSANTIAQFDAAYAAYNALTTAQKAKVDSDIKSNFMVDYVIELTNSLPSTITLSDGATISKALAIYDTLNATEKNAVINYDTLVAAKASYDALASQAIECTFAGSPSNSAFTVSGKYGPTEATIGGVSYSTGLKMETSTTVSFSTAVDMTMTMHVTAGKKIKVDGTSYTVPSDGILTVTIKAGSHTITKDTTNTLLYYVQLV